MCARRCSFGLARAARRRSGLSSIYFVFLLGAIIGFVSMAVDIGRIRLARTELQVAADASARAGADSLPVSTPAVIDAAVDTAENNGVIDAEESKVGHKGERTNPGVALVPSEDLEFGIWSPANRTFTILTDNAGTGGVDERRAANAVHVTGRRITERNNPIPLVLAPVLGVFSSDIEREAIGYITGGPDKFGFIGLDWVRANGNNATIDSVRLPSTTRRYNGWVASNGDIDINNGNIYGDARPGIGKTIDYGPNANITGWQASLNYTLNFPPASVPSKAVRLNPDPPQKNKPLSINGSNSASNPKEFWCSSLNHPDPLTVFGYAILYVNGDVNIQGNQIINGDDPAHPNPSKLEIRVVGSHNVDLGGTSTQYCHIYAPQSNVKVHGTTAFFGWIVGKTLLFEGTCQLHYDESRDNHVPYHITLVR